jgi:protein TonB
MEFRRNLTLSFVLHAVFLFTALTMIAGRDAVKRISPSPVYVELMSEPAQSAPQKHIIAIAGSMPPAKLTKAPSPPVSAAPLSNQTEVKATTVAVAQTPKEVPIDPDKKPEKSDSGQPQGFHLITSGPSPRLAAEPSTAGYAEIKSSVRFVSGTVEGKAKGHADAMAAIRAALERAKNYPQTAKRRGIEGTAIVEFSIDIKGMPENVKIEKSSGSDILDSAALSTITRAAPFPHDIRSIKVPISFRLEKED